MRLVTAKIHREDQYIGKEDIDELTEVRADTVPGDAMMHG